MYCCLLNVAIVTSHCSYYRHSALKADRTHQQCLQLPTSLSLSLNVVLPSLLQDDMAEVESTSSIDTARLSSFLDIDVPDLQNILDSATEGIAFLLQQVQVKAGEYEQINNAKELLEVNYGTP